MSLTDILKTEKIIKVAEDETLSSVLKKLRSSHDSAFVFSNENQYLGLVNPYYCLIKSSYPGNAKVKHCLFHAPKIYLDMPLVRVAQFLIESKVHYLPVFSDKDKNEFLGIISARRLLSYFKNLDIFKIKIDEILKNKKPLVTINENEPINKALYLFRQTHYSKLIVINSGERLKGILSYFDLIFYLASPKKRDSFGERGGEKVGFLNLPVKSFAKTAVITLEKDNLLSDAINLILEKKIGSVIIIDEEKKPHNVITTRDFLRFFVQKETAKVKTNISALQFGGFFNRK